MEPTIYSFVYQLFAQSYLYTFAAMAFRATAWIHGLIMYNTK